MAYVEAQHPRDYRGRWIEKIGGVDVFGSPSSLMGENHRIVATNNKAVFWEDHGPSHDEVMQTILGYGTDDQARAESAGIVVGHYRADTNELDVHGPSSAQETTLKQLTETYPDVAAINWNTDARFRKGTILYKGMGRALGEEDGLPVPNDMGLIFATTDEDTARKYSEQWGESYTLAFFLSADAAIADLNDADTVRKIVDYMGDYGSGWQGEDISEDDEMRGALVEQIVGQEDHSDDELGEIAIMDDPGFAEAVAETGYDGATQNGQYALFPPEAWMDTPAIEALPEDQRYPDLFA